MSANSINPSQSGNHLLLRGVQLLAHALLRAVALRQLPRQPPQRRTQLARLRLQGVGLVTRVCTVALDMCLHDLDHHKGNGNQGLPYQGSYRLLLRQLG
jgi:hypothetical protein